jgi:IPT/TIG domain
VKITGTGFVAGAKVTIGNEATSVTVVSSTEITATTAATAAGSDEVIVSDTNGTSTGGPSYTYTSGTAAPTSITAAPQIVLFPPPYGVGLFKVSATLTSGGKPVVGRPIVFSVGTTHLCSATTGATGTASCTLTVQGEVAVLRANRYTASFAGDSSFLGSSASTPAIEFGSGKPGHGHHADTNTHAAVARVLRHAAGACFATLRAEQHHPGHGGPAGNRNGARCSQLFTLLSRAVSRAAAKPKHS